MNSEDLLKEISKTLTKHKVEKLSKIAAKGEVSVTSVIELTFYHEPAIAFRAAWILEHILIHAPKRFFADLETFLSGYPKQKNQSCRRHYSKIMMARNVYDRLENMSAEIIDSVVETTFEWLIDEQTPVAVKVNCLDILFLFRKKYDWIADELKPQVEFLLKDGSAAMQSRGKRILKKLERKA